MSACPICKKIGHDETHHMAAAVPKITDVDPIMDRLDDHGPGCDGPFNCVCFPPDYEEERSLARFEAMHDDGTWRLKDRTSIY